MENRKRLRWVTAVGALGLAGVGGAIGIACTGDPLPVVVPDASTDTGVADVAKDTAVLDGSPADVTPDVGIFGTGKFTKETYLPLVAGDGGPTTAQYGIAAADLNGDKHLDLVISGGNANSVLVYIGKGNGTFDPPVAYAAGANPFFVTVADFNGDQKPDLAVANYASGNLSVLLNSGGGTFAAPVNYLTGNATVYVIAVDVNGDNVKDLVAAEQGGSKVDVLLGSANGTFGAAVPFTVVNPWNVTAVDLTGDQKLDLVVGTSSGNVYVMVNNGTNTLFNAPVAYATDPVEAGITNGAYAPLYGDFNGDNAKELAVAKCTGQNALVALPSAGNGVFNPPPASAVTLFPTSGCLYDMTQGLLDPDGIPDLVMGGQAVYVRSSSLLDGGNEAAITAYAPDAGDAAAPYVKTIAVGDLDEDGVQDLAAVVSGKPYAFLLFGVKK